MPGRGRTIVIPGTTITIIKCIARCCPGALVPQARSLGAGSDALRVPSGSSLPTTPSSYSLS